MKYEDIKVGMKVKIHMDEEGELYNRDYQDKYGIVANIDRVDIEYPIGVNVTVHENDVDVDVGFEPDELEEVK